MLSIMYSLAEQDRHGIRLTTIYSMLEPRSSEWYNFPHLTGTNRLCSPLKIEYNTDLHWGGMFLNAKALKTF